jgi:hypothetical protein
MKVSTPNSAQNGAAAAIQGMRRPQRDLVRSLA